MQEFGLSLEETRIMFSLQYYLVSYDIQCETDFEKKSLKSEWLLQWKNSTELFFKSQLEKSSHSQSNYNLIININLLKQEIKKINKDIGNKLTIYLILLEVTLFIPYYNLGEDNEKNLKDLKFYEENKLTAKIEDIAILLEIDKTCVQRFKSNYKEAINGISGKGFSLLIGTLVGTLILTVAAAFFTPIIAAALAPILAPGLSGAAAVSAVLAALGGGALAAGGFGMAGGVAVIVAGGAILGGTAGAGVGTLFAQSPDTALTQAAKLEVVIKEIVFVQKDIRKAQEIIKEQRQAIRSLEDKLDELMFEKPKKQQAIENLKKAIDYLNKALKRNQELL